MDQTPDQTPAERRASMAGFCSCKTGIHAIPGNDFCANDAGSPNTLLLSRTDGRLEDASEKIHTIVCLKKGESVTESELIDHCKSLIAAFKCPISIEFHDDPMPLSGTGNS